MRGKPTKPKLPQRHNSPHHMGMLGFTPLLANYVCGRTATVMYSEACCKFGNANKWQE